MTTMLERAARAMEDRLYQLEQDEDGPDCYRRLGRSEYVELTRAVLMAVRELPDEIIDEHLYDNEYGYAMYYEGWQPAIDAILNEDPTA